MRGYAAIRTEDLYVLYLLDRTGRLGRDEFWRGLFSTKGPINMRPCREKLTAEKAQQLEGIPQTRASQVRFYPVTNPLRLHTKRT